MALAEFLHDREELVDAREVSPGATGGSEAQVLVDCELGENAPPLGHEGDAEPRHILRPAADERASVQPDVAPRRPHQAHHRLQRRRLPGAVRPDEADDLAAVDGQGQAAHRLHGAVPNLQVLELEDRRAHSATALSPRYAAATSRFARMSAGAPSASVRPWSRTWMRSQISMISAML